MTHFNRAHFLNIVKGGTKRMQGFQLLDAAVDALYENDNALYDEIGSRVNSLPQLPSENRQSIIRGRTATGGFDFLETGSNALSLTIKAAVTSLIVTFADGFSDEQGAVDYIESVTDDVVNAYSNLPANSTVYLYIERIDKNSLQFGYSTIQPKYQTMAPAMDNGAHWFDTSSMKMFYYNGTTWIGTKRLFIARVQTGADAIDSVLVVSRYQDFMTRSQGDLSPLIDYNYNQATDQIETIPIISDVQGIPSAGFIMLKGVPAKENPSTLKVSFLDWLRGPILNTTQTNIAVNDLNLYKVNDIIVIGNEAMKVTNKSNSTIVITQLSAAISSTSATSISVASGTGFSGVDVIQVDNEKMQVASINGNTLTVTRAYGGTTAATHRSGANVLGLTNLIVQRAQEGTLPDIHLGLDYVRIRMTEVPTEPTQGQFLANYNTQGEWNTGKIYFNEEDVGKPVIADYQSIGRLVRRYKNESESGVPDWLRDFGSGIDGNYISTTRNVALSEGIYEFNNFIVLPGHTLSLPTSTIIKCRGTAMIFGTVTVAPHNAGKGTGGGAGGRGGRSHSSAATDNGYVSEININDTTLLVASSGNTPTSYWKRRSLMYQQLKKGGNGGKGSSFFTGLNTYAGGSGGRGGGCLICIAESFLFTGTINAKGENGKTGVVSYRTGGGGGGGGGCVILSTRNMMIDTGTINCDGGIGGIRGEQYDSGYHENGQKGAAGWWKKLIVS
ncbi:hypothetical protein [Acetonema longum]|uniref:hypothetical protein n=1 Tax=Acetonema longum TaxID=2374 RepID=UPI0002E2CDDF|nr:hypothetical protein [Acetonema longum]